MCVLFFFPPSFSLSLRNLRSRSYSYKREHCVRVESRERRDLRATSEAGYD